MKAWEVKESDRLYHAGLKILSQTDKVHIVYLDKHGNKREKIFNNMLKAMKFQKKLLKGGKYEKILEMDPVILNRKG